MDPNVPTLIQALKEADARGDVAEATKIATALKEIAEATEKAGMAPTIANLRVKQAGASAADYMVDRAKSGLASGVGLLNFMQAAATGDLNPQAMEDLAKKKVEEATGFTNYQAPNVVAKWAGAVPEALSDPLTYVLPGGGLVKKAAESVLPALGAKFGEIVSEERSPMVQAALQVLGGVAGGLGNAQVARIPKLGGTVAQGVKSGFEHFGEKGLTKVNEKAGMLAEQHIRTVLQAAVKADPNLAEEIVKLQARNNVLGTDLPISSIANNPVIKAAIGTMAVKDPSFVASFTKQFEAAKNSLAETAAGEFGDPIKAKEAIEAAMSKYAKSNPELFDMQAAKELDLRGKDIEAFQTSLPIAPSWMAPTVEGRNTRKFYQPEAKTSPRSVPFWTKADEIATKENVYLPENGVREIYTEVASTANEQKFRKFGGVWGAINDKFAPVIDPDNKAVRQWNPASYQDFRSLQAKISEQLRELNPMSESYGTDKVNLSKLSNTVNQAADKYFPEELATNLKKARTQYAYDSTLKDIGNKAFNDKGFLDEGKLEAWLKDPANRSAVQNLVEPTTNTRLRDPIQSVRMGIGRIMAEKDQLDSFHTRLMQQKIEDLSGMTPQQIVSKAYTDTRFTKDFLEKYGKDMPTLNALRAWMLDDILISPEALKVVTSDKNKVATFERVFGFGYMAKLNQLAAVTDTLQKNPAAITFDLKSAPKDILEQAIPGVSFPSAAAKFRDPIKSSTQAVIELFSKALATKAEMGFESRLKQLLLDPQKIRTYLDEMKTAIDTKEPVKYTSQLGKLFLKLQTSGVIPNPAEAGRQMVKGGVIGAKQPDE